MLTPEHIHLAINHAPIIGIAAAMVPLFLGILKNDRLTAGAGLLLTVLCAWTVPFIMGTGEAAYERYSHGAIAAVLDPAASHYMLIHYERAEFWAKIIYGTAVLSTIALGLSLIRKRDFRWLNILVLVCCLVSVLAGVWIAESGGKIRRPDFRSAPSGSFPTQVSAP